MPAKVVNSNSFGSKVGSRRLTMWKIEPLFTHESPLASASSVMARTIVAFDRS